MKIQTAYTPVPIGEVEVTDGDCQRAFAREIDYLLSLQEGRFLAGFYENAGLKTPFVRYGGWESGLMSGHALGHYLTALAQAQTAPGLPEETRSRLFAKMKAIADGLLVCQERVGSGLIWGAPMVGGDIEAQFRNVEAGRTDIEREAWVPWYTLHKLLAGLVESYKLTDYPAALTVASRLGDWVSRQTSRWDEDTRRTVLRTEYGGMNDCLYELYSLTGRAEHALAAHAFDEEPLFDRVISMERDVLDDLHANTTIPKFLGALNRYLTLHGRELCGEKVDASRYLRAAECFFETVVSHHTYVTGGNSEWERFGKDDVLDAERTNCNCETCNVYNMMKLARGLFCVTGDVKYSDYYDNAFRNTVLSSQDPETGMTTYFQPMASGYFKVFSSPDRDFWCCTGSGMENFTKLGDGVYFAHGKNLFLERYLSSVLREEDREVEVSCGFPYSEAVITVRRAAEPFLLCLRVPEWAAGFPTVEKNGGKVRALEGGGHLSVAVKEGDEVKLSFPVELTLHGLPDGKGVFAFRYGSVLLSADCGTREMSVTRTGANVAIPAAAAEPPRVIVKDLYRFFETPSDFVTVEGEKFTLRTDPPLVLTPHFRRCRERYAIYLQVGEEKP